MIRPINHVQRSARWNWCWLVLISPFLHAQEDLSVLKYWNYHQAQPAVFYQHLMKTARQQLTERNTAVAALATREDWQQRQQQMAQVLREIAGDFPARTPLKPVITGTLERDGVRVEKLYFESRPGYYVTAALFLPARFTGKLPAIVYCSGHSANGFRSEAYQRIILNYAKKGFAVLAFDPIGQGERIQYFKEDGKPRFGPTHEHSYPGSQSFVSGRSPANYFIWDGIRAVDYLVSREEIDPDRIGIAGRSGGGTQSAYIAAFDERILAAAPECYLTSMDKLLRSKGPQDAEQVFMHALAKGFDLADLVVVRAPKPLLMVTTTNDIFSIEGAREVFAEASRAYKALGNADALQMVEDDAGHASTLKNREASYAFFQKHLKNPGSSRDQEISLFQEAELFVTPEGSVYRSLKGESLFSLNFRYTSETISERDRSGQDRAGQDRSFGAVQQVVLEKSRYRQPAPVGEVIFSGRIPREGYVIEKFLVKAPGDYFLPVLWMKPEKPVAGSLLWLDENGNQKAAEKEGAADRLAKAGYAVILADLNGVGELSDAALSGGDARIEAVPLNLWYLSILTDQSMAGVRMGEIKRLTDFIRDRMTAQPVLSLVATGTLCTDALQATMTDAGLFHKKVLVQPLVSFQSLVARPEFRVKYVSSVVAGALVYYDLPELAAVQPPGSVLLLNPVAGDGTTLKDSEAKAGYARAIQRQQLVEPEMQDANGLAKRLIGFLNKP